MQHRLAIALLLLGALLLLASSGIILNANRDSFTGAGGNAGAVVPPATTAIPFATSPATPTIARTPLFERPSTPATATATAPVAVTPNAIALGKPKLTVTFASIGIELPFGGDNNGNANATVAFKPEGESAWRAGLPLWAANGDLPTPGRVFYGSALLLKAGTKYDLRVTVADPDGVAGEKTVTGTATTRAENIPQAANLKPTHFINPAGDEGQGGPPPRPGVPSMAR